MPRRSLRERFERSVARGEPAECWEWTGYTDRCGYGTLAAPHKPRKAHRIAYELHHGVALKADQLILHSCDNRRCVNPAHLRVGTHRENMLDRSTRGRQTRGERVNTAKLTEAQVLDIRSSTRLGTELARQYGVCPTQISCIRLGKTWKHLLPSSNGCAPADVLDPRA